MKEHNKSAFLSCMYLLSLVLLVGFAFYGQKQSSTVAVNSEIVTAVDYTIILDAGHGGPDGGASASDGTLESTLNLQIAKKADAVLGLFGINTKMLRTSDSDLSDADAVSISQKKVSDIRNRVAIANATPNGIIVSIHENTFSESKYHGAQVFYCKNGTSDALADLIQSNIKNTLDATNNRAPKKISADVYLMNHIDIPGVLIECGFMTNPDELANLKSDGYQKKLAAIIAASIFQYLGKVDEV